MIPHSRPALFAATATLVVAAAWPAVVRADESEGARLFREGREAMLDGRFADACPKLAESERLEPHTGTLLNLAACNERLGKVGSAWVEYNVGQTAARVEGQNERAQFAGERLDAVATRVPWITIDVREPARSLAGLVVTLDGATIVPTAFGKDMPVDPGSHVVVATAPHRLRFEAIVDVRESERRNVPVDALASDGTSAPAPETVILDAGRRDQATREAKEPEDDRTRFVLEVGPMVGFMAVTGAANGNRPDITIRPSGATSSATTSCTPQVCTVSASDGGMFLGATAFVGYALTDALHVGGRFIGGARASDGGGNLLAAGPELSYRVDQSIRVGLSLLVASAIVYGPATVTLGSGYAFVSGNPSSDESGNTGLGGGAGALLDWELAKVGHGALEFVATPLFFVAPGGTAWSIPFGFAYRSR